ncbi:hypothetical protein [Amycolatopsis pithecellobii]|uniref:Uncharacterized protein n=1 Tax=Amycolatopsis pithecellobii TaxID=664692 RepID=A0A6N7Z6Z0_9PSEU|nr:hypothetical protein [Amycolatopsis pithecellobii]MTD55466.1 hypothetical protein [Amycolatopsis pithecellobii]
MNRFDDNVGYDAGGTFSCVHCATVLAAPGEPPLHRAVLLTGDVPLAGPHVQVPEPPVVDEDVEFRQLLCPSCGTALRTEVVARADVLTRAASLSAQD